MISSSIKIDLYFPLILLSFILIIENDFNKRKQNFISEILFAFKGNNLKLLF